MHKTMKKLFSVLCAALLMCVTANAKDIRIVEISTGSYSSSTYDSDLRSILETISGVSKIVTDVTNLVLTVTYDADKVSVDDIVGRINEKEPRFKAQQKSEPKTKEWVKAEKKRDEAEQKVSDAREKANKRDQEKKDAGDKKDDKKADKKGK